MEAPQKILDKIKKLKALSEGAAQINSIPESEAAALLMNNLLTKYNLSLMDIDDTDNSKPSIEIKRSDLISVQNPYGRLWKERLLMTLCMYNYCKVIACSYKVFVLGTKVNTTAVIDFFNTLQSVYLDNGKERYDQDTKERKLLSHWVIIVVSLWLLFVLAILSLNRLLELKLSDTVLCMLLGTTTINILGLAYIVLKGLFDRKQ